MALAINSDQLRIAEELADTVIRDLFGVGLTLQQALGHVSGSAAEPLVEAIDGLDRIIRSVRDVVFDLSRPARPVRPPRD